MGIPYLPGNKAEIDEMATPILSRQGQSQTSTVKVQDYGNSVLGPGRCFADGLYAKRNSFQLRCLLRYSTEAPKSIVKQTAQACCQKVFCSSTITQGLTLLE
ncbi:hypothetical protein TNCV_3056381 [Trichonephila clavipes]|nr:hypothetical protein TNCV_3056381 [Trichonephila clavipes]